MRRGRRLRRRASRRKSAGGRLEQVIRSMTGPLDGVVSNRYAEPYGEGRVAVIDEKPEMGGSR